MQELLEHELQLNEEIDRLKSEKAKLLNLERVERIVTEELGYRYPEPEQFIKVYDDEDEVKR
jgi:cell division protein FtsL